MEKKEYTVWVGGGEVNDSYLTLLEAQKLAFTYVKDGFDDVVIEFIPIEEQ